MFDNLFFFFLETEIVFGLVAAVDITDEHVVTLLENADKDNSMTIEFDEFCQVLFGLSRLGVDIENILKTAAKKKSGSFLSRIRRRSIGSLFRRNDSESSSSSNDDDDG